MPPPWSIDHSSSLRPLFFDRCYGAVLFRIIFAGTYFSLALVFRWHLFFAGTCFSLALVFRWHMWLLDLLLSLFHCRVSLALVFRWHLFFAGTCCSYGGLLSYTVAVVSTVVYFPTRLLLYLWADSKINGWEFRTPVGDSFVQLLIDVSICLRQGVAMTIYYVTFASNVLSTNYAEPTVVAVLEKSP